MKHSIHNIGYGLDHRAINILPEYATCKLCANQHGPVCTKCDKKAFWIEQTSCDEHYRQMLVALLEPARLALVFPEERSTKKFVSPR